MTPDTPAARVLAALAAAPDGLTYEQLRMRNGVARLTPSLVRAAVDALAASGAVWSLPLRTHRCGWRVLYFVPGEYERESSARVR